jgi:hypothetical protein
MPQRSGLHAPERRHGFSFAGVIVERTAFVADEGRSTTMADFPT